MKSVFYTIIRGILMWPARLLFRVHIKGAKNEPKKEAGPYLVCANHQSVLDPVFICLATHRQQPHFMAKKEVFRVPVIGFLVKKLGAYPVARGKGDVGAIKHTIQLIQDGYSVGMFPQGTRCPNREPRGCALKNGIAMIAAHTEVQILPIHIKMKHYKWKFFRRVDITVGEPIPFSKFHYDHEASGEYARITGEIFEEICRLGDTPNA